MQLDDEICLCFHVSKRKVLSFLRTQQPRRASQLSQCYGAGTGCGWCRTLLERLFDEHAGKAVAAPEPTAPDHFRGRSEYIRQGRGTPPPGAAPY